MTARQIVEKLRKGENVYIREDVKEIFLSEIVKHKLLDMSKEAKLHLCLVPAFELSLIKTKKEYKPCQLKQS